MRYDADRPFDEWKAEAKEKLTELLGLPLEKCNPELEIEYREEFETYTEYRFTVQTELGYYVPCHLLIPKECRCALVIEARNFGESSINGYGTSCKEAAKAAILMGRTVIGERVWDAIRILDAVEDKFHEVDMTNIVCTGNSGGGTATYYLACMDERITAAAPSCSICTYEESIAAMPHCMCNHIPGIRKFFEMGILRA